MSPTTQDYWGQYQQKSKERQDFIDTMASKRDAGVNQLKTEQGYNDKKNALDSATKTLYETQKRLDALPQQTQQRTSGRPVTQAQLDRIISAESQPLTQEYKNAGLGAQQAREGLNSVEQAVKDYVTGFNQDSQLKYNDLLAGSNSLYDLYSKSQDRDFQAQQAEAQRQAQKQQLADEYAFQERLQKLLASINSPTTATVTPTTQNIDLNSLPEIKDTAPNDFGSTLGSNLNLIKNGLGNIFDPNAWNNNIFKPIGSAIDNILPKSDWSNTDVGKTLARLRELKKQGKI